MEHFLTPLLLLLIVVAAVAYIAFGLLGLICAWITFSTEEEVSLKTRVICGLVASLTFVLLWATTSYVWSIS